MRVSIPFAQGHMGEYPYPVGAARQEVFTRRGGIYFGVAQLLGYATPYTRKIHRFADYKAGWYASRNAAFQHAVSVAGDRNIALDGVLLIPGTALEKPGQTETAIRTLSATLDMDSAAIRRELEKGKSLHFNDSPLYTAIFKLAENRVGKRLPRESLPGLVPESSQTFREGTAAGFASRVYDRYLRCMQSQVD